MPAATRSGRNVEIKARLLDRAGAVAICESLGGVYTSQLIQTDTYFATPSGRLKLREEAGGPTILIEYDRPDAQSGVGSSYTLHALDTLPDHLRSRMTNPIAVVHKTRDLWMLENVRIHLDSVDGLGDFLEFEAMVGDAHDEAACKASVDQLLGEFACVIGPVMGLSNLDLALNRHSRAVPAPSAGGGGNPRTEAGSRSTGCPPSRA